MREPYLSQFRELIRQGAGTLDIHDGQTGSSYTTAAIAPEPLIDREVIRTDVHLNSLCKLLEKHVGPVNEVLDVGCGTGATTVAMGLADGLGAKKVIGIDPNTHSLAAAEVRAKGHGVGDDKVEFKHVAAGDPFPYDTDRFDLVVCVSVLEYLYTHSSRLVFTKELLRVAKPGGTVCLVTPNPFRLFDYHTHRLLGDFRRVEGYPWASTPSELAELFAGHEVRFLRSEQIEHGLSKRGIPIGGLLKPFGSLGHLLPWQKVLVTKSRAGSTGRVS